jgi:hypothetical protein
LEANQAVSIFVKLQILCRLQILRRDAASVQSQTLENSQTREKLVIKGATGFYTPTTISRYPFGTNEEEWSEEMSQCQNIDNRMIKFVS